jgi:bacillopeptidase F
MEQSSGTRQVSSRLIKQERKKLVRQTLIFVMAAVVLVLIFIFVILPLFIRFINGVLNTNPITEDDSVMLQPPVLSAPVDATNSAQLKIDGFDSPEHEIVVVLNGQEHTRVQTSEDGSFSADVTLTEGENSLSAYSLDLEENESKAGENFTIMLDTEKPTLTVTEPVEGATINSRDRLVTVAGTTDAGSKVYVNDRVVFPAADGSFSTRHTLVDGKNELIIKSVDKAGNQIEQKITVEFTP